MDLVRRKRPCYDAEQNCDAHELLLFQQACSLCAHNLSYRVATCNVRGNDRDSNGPHFRKSHTLTSRPTLGPLAPDMASLGRASGVLADSDDETTASSRTVAGGCEELRNCGGNPHERGEINVPFKN
jgi:hypothetical protein